MLRSAFVLSGAAILQHRACLGTEPASAPNLVRCYYESRSRVNGEMSFWNSRGCGRVLVAIVRRWREQRMRISEFTAYSLFFTVVSGGAKPRISRITDAAGGCAELSVARHLY